MLPSPPPLWDELKVSFHQYMNKYTYKAESYNIPRQHQDQAYNTMCSLHLLDLYRSYLLLSLNHSLETDCHLQKYGYMGTWMTKTGTDDRLLSLTSFHYIQWTVYNLHTRNPLKKNSKPGAMRIHASDAPHK